MKKTTIPVLVFAISAFLAGIFVTVKATTSTHLTDQERLAMEKLPGYRFSFEGKTNLIVQAASHETFLDQHPMMPYLEIVVDRLERNSWTRDCVIRVQETESQIVITVPSWAEQRGMTGPTVFHAGYSRQIIIDKNTKKIISAVVG